MPVMVTVREFPGPAARELPVKTIELPEPPGAPQVATPAAVQVHWTLVSSAGTGSVKMRPLASEGPLLVTTTV